MKCKYYKISTKKDLAAALAEVPDDTCITMSHVVNIGEDTNELYTETESWVETGGCVSYAFFILPDSDIGYCGEFIIVCDERDPKLWPTA